MSNRSRGGILLGKLPLFFVLIIFALFSTGGFSSKNIEEVHVYEMESFSLIKKDSVTSYTDPGVVSDLIKAFKQAKKDPGVAEMPEPEYKVEFGEESYYLWIDKEYGTIMNFNDTHTTYTLSKGSAKIIYDLVN